MTRSIVAGSLFCLAAVGSGGCSSGANESVGSTANTAASAITTDDVISRAEEWVAAKVPYCQSANHQHDDDTSCASVCNRPDNPTWDPYRSDCSGFVSWAWGLPAPGNDTSGFAPADTSVSHTIDASSLQAGDAVNIPGDHILLFKNWNTQNQNATFIEEPGCSSSLPYAREVVSNVTVSGTRITIAYEGKTFTAIRYDGLSQGSSPSPPPPATGGSTGSGNAPGSSGSNGGGQACASDGDCNTGSDGSGQICVQGTCTPGCNANWECPGDTSCVSGQCQ